MSRFDERPRGVMVKVLDMSELEASALEYRQRTHPDCYNAKIYGGKTAVAEKDGKLFMICTEGVGYEVTDEEPAYFEFHGNYVIRDEETGEIVSGKESFDFMPFAEVTKTPAELMSYPVVEEVDLADFIRSFGARLESNFWLWFKELS
jgi:hypothetical protein